MSQFSEQMEQMIAELRQEDLINELRSLNLGQKIPLIEQAQDEQQLMLRELHGLNLPAAVGRLEAAVAELQATDMAPLLMQEVQALKNQTDALQARLGDTSKDLAGLGQQREQELLQLEQRLLEAWRSEQQTQPRDAAVDADLREQFARLEESHELHRQHVSTMFEQAGAPQALHPQLVEIRGQAQALDDRQRKQEADFLGRLQGLEDAVMQRAAMGTQQATMDYGYEPETEIQMRGLQQAVESLQESNRMVCDYIGIAKDGSPKRSGSEERMASALEAEVTRRCMLVADLHSRLAREVAVVSRHVELRWEELAARIDAESSARKDSLATIRKGLRAS
uniref:Uncharacterized protein n=1 Tax=Alexandrium catenella TaxID=2925 RepID=A0A7S1WWA6_ALECA